MGGGTTRGAHEFEKFETSSYTKFKHIQIDPLTVVAPTPSSRGALANEGALLGSKAELGDKMATETQSDEAPFWIVEVEGKEQEVPRDYVCPLAAPEHADVIFEFPRGKMALLVRRLRPMVTLRGAVSSVVGDRLLRCALPRAVPSTSIGKNQIERSHDHASSSQRSTQRWQRSSVSGSCCPLRANSR
jgi:hypothetical protein